MTKNLQYESGRSMVEMLGTLAIIGVLSIGGIAGYSYGMDKYRANQTMRDISLRTVDLLTQASQGRTELSLAEWDKETTIYDFANPAYVEGENLIAFDVGTTKKLPKSVCQMVFDGLSNTVAQIDINGTPSTSNDNCGEDNTMTFYFAAGGNASAGTGTGGGTTGEQCGSTVCGTCQKCENETCVTAHDYEMKCTTNDNKTGWCVSGTCEPDTTCNCGPNQYCADKNTSSNHPTPDKCKDLNFRTEKIDGTTYYISNDEMSWWDAVSACKALGNKQLLSVYDFIDSADDTGQSSYVDIQTAFGKELFEKAWNSSINAYIWLKEPTDKTHATYMFYVANDGYVWFNFMYTRENNNSFYAVCR